MKIYMDVCCLNRPFDYQYDDRINIESEAILKILYRCQDEEWQLLGSDIIDFEISKMLDYDKKQKVLMLYNISNSKTSFNSTIYSLSLKYKNKGLKQFDSMHLASAIVAKADVLLTTDKKFIRIAQQITDLAIEVKNPVNWFMEVISNENDY